MTHKKDKSSENLEDIKIETDRDIDLEDVEKEDKKDKKISSLEDRVKILEKDLSDVKEKYLMALADLENFKKRSSKERADLLKYQGESILVDIIEVLDNLDRALEHGTSENTTEESLESGLKLIHKQFVDVLSRWGVKSESSIGQIFDPEKHNALSRIVSKEAKANEIISEFKKLYYYKDKILRHAQVVVCCDDDAK